MEDNKKTQLTITLPSANTEGWLVVRLQALGNDTTFAVKPQNGKMFMRQNDVDLLVEGPDEVEGPKPVPKEEPKIVPKAAPVPLYAKPVTPPATSSKTGAPKPFWGEMPSPLDSLTYRAFRKPGQLLHVTAKLLAHGPRLKAAGLTAEEILPIVQAFGATMPAGSDGKVECAAASVIDIRNKLYTLGTHGLLKETKTFTLTGKQISRFLWQGEEGLSWMKNETPAQLHARIKGIWPKLLPVRYAQNGILRREALYTIIRKHTSMTMYSGVHFFVENKFVVPYTPDFLIVGK
jgi:hypothetical protein